MLNVRLIANAGVLVTVGGVKILSDALHTHKTTRFSRTPQDLLEDIINGAGRFSHIDYMLISHCHPDHCDTSAVQAFLSIHSETRVFAPAPLELVGGRVFALNDEVERFNFGKVKIKAGTLKHDGKAYADVVNYGYIVDIGGYALLFTGDAAIDMSAIGGFVGERRIDTAFLPFPYVSLQSGRDVINTAIKPKSVVAFHLPFAEDDKGDFIKSTSYVIKREKDRLPETVMLYKHGQEAEI